MGRINLSDLIENKKQISYGKLISKKDFASTSVIPIEVKEELKKSGEYYLWIFIPGEDIIKLSVYPCPSSSIKKILIRLKEFSPDLVKGISEVLKNFQLGDATIHTTGLCFSGQNCFYETYVDASELAAKALSLEKIKENFKNVHKVVSVELLDIPVSGL